MAEFYTLSNLQDKYTDVHVEHCTDIQDRRHFKPTWYLQELCTLAAYYTYFEIQLIYHLLQSLPYKLSPSTTQVSVYINL